MRDESHSISRAVFLSVALTATGIAVKIAGGNFHPAAIALIGVAIVTSLAALLRARVPFLESASARSLRVAGVVLIGITLVALFVGRVVPPTTAPETATPPMYAILNFHGIAPPAPLADGATAVRVGHAFVAALGIATLCGGLSRRPLWRSLSAGLLVVTLIAHLITQCVAVHAAPAPVIDVLVFQSASIDALLKGDNPYAGPFVDITGGTSPHYDPSLMADGLLLFGYPYPPLTLYCLLLSGLMATSVQYAHAAAFTVSAALIGFCRPTPTARFAAVLFMLTPTGALVVCYGWTEPLVALFLAATVFLACRFTSSRAWLLVGLSLGLFWVAKQYVPLTAPLAFLLLTPPIAGRSFPRLLIPAILAGAVVTLPLALWDWGAFWHSTVAVQLRQPFREDALSFLALLYRGTGQVPPTWVGFVMLAGAMALALWRSPRGPAGFATSLAVALLVFFAFSKQAFAGYYFLVSAALACALATGAPEVSTGDDLATSLDVPASRKKRSARRTTK